MKELLLYLAIKCKFNWKEVYDILSNETFTVEIKVVEKLALEFKNKFITIFDKEYPVSLRISTNPPLLFFYHGNIELLKTEKLYVSGEKRTFRDKVLFNQIKTFFTEEKDYSMVIDKLDLTGREVLQNKNLNKILITDNSTLETIDVDEEHSLVLSPFPLKNTEYFHFTNSFDFSEEKILNFKTLICDKVVFVNETTKRKDFKTIIQGIENNKMIFGIQTKEYNTFNRKLINNGVIELTNIKEITRWKN